MAEVVGAILISSLVADTTVASFAAGGWAVSVTAPATTLFGLSAATVGSAALVGGALLGGALLARPSQAAFAMPSASDGTATVKQPIPSRIMGYGRARISGSYMLYESTSTTNYSIDVIALHYGAISAIQQYYLNDDLVLINGSGYVYRFYSNATQATEFRYTSNTPDTYSVDLVSNAFGGRYSFVQIKTRLGAATETAYSEVISTELSSVWTTAHRGDGIASMMIKCAAANSSQYLSVYKRGLPKASVVADLAPIFDPRDGTQSRGTPSTWLVSRNPVIQLINYLTDSTRGLGQDWDTLIEPQITALKAQADICDVLVTRANGTTEARYAASGWFTLDTDPAEILGTMLAACDGWMAERGDGTLSIIVGKYVTPTKTLTDAHIIGFQIAHGVDDEDAVNEIKFTYNSPGNDYREAAGDPWRDTAAISAMGRVRSQTLRLNWVQSHSQGRRLAKRAMLRYQARLRGTLTTTLYGLACLGERWIAVQSTSLADLSNAVIEITRARVDIQNARVTFDWILVNPNVVDAWDAATEEGTEPSFIGAITLIHVPTVTGHTGVASKIRITITDPSQPTYVYVIQYTPTGTSNWVQEMFLTYTPSAGSIVFNTSTVSAGTYDVRIAAINSENIQSSWATTTATV